MASLSGCLAILGVDNAYHTGGIGGSGGAGSGGATTGATSTSNATTSDATTAGSTTATSSSTGTGCAAAGQDFKIPSCNDCLASNCCAEQTKCNPGTECDKVYMCLQNCAPGDAACTKACGTTNMTGATDHDALVTCLQGSCQMECTQGGKICDSGLATPNKPECGDCLGMSCCTEFDACTADAACKACLLNPMGAGCATNMLAMAANTCANTKCAMQCAP